MKKISAVASVLCLLTLFCASPAPAADDAAIKEQIKNILRESPQIILDVLQENDADLFDIVQSAAIKRQKMAEESRMEKQFTKPLTPVIEEGRLVRGNPKAPITIVEYSDFQCPYCSRAGKVMDEILRRYQGQVRLMYKHNPLINIHPMAVPTASYFEAVAKQSEAKAWQFHDMIFMNQEKLKEGEPALMGLAATLKVDMKKLHEDIKADDIKRRIEMDVKEATQFGFTGTPTFLINGVTLKGAQPVEAFAEIIDRHLEQLKKK